MFSPLVSCDVEIYEHVGIWEHLQLDSMLPQEVFRSLLLLQVNANEQL